MGQLCGQHALNNFVQGPSFTIVQLAEIAHQLDRLESNIMTDTSSTVSTTSSNGDENRRPRRGNHPPLFHDGTTTGTSGADSSHHVDEAGNFSIEVLKAALLQSYNVNLIHNQSESVQAYLQTNDITTIQGFICHKNDHWFCIRKLHNRYWNLNSTLEYPTVISHFALATEMELYATQHGYTIFCILPPQTLPEPPTSVPLSPLLASEENDGTWHDMSDLLSGVLKSSATTAAAATTTTKSIDPWGKLTGTGRRLDGQRTNQNNNIATAMVTTPSYATIDGLTDDEMLQIALQESMEPSTDTTNSVMNAGTAATTTSVADLLLGPLPKEPVESDNDNRQPPNIIKIQFRLPPPQNQRTVRRFYTTNTIADIYSYIGSIVPSHQHHHLECLVGYPPQNIFLLYPNPYTTTIEETNWANTTIQIRLQSN
jgi:ataxin-3